MHPTSAPPDPEDFSSDLGRDRIAQHLLRVVLAEIESASRTIYWKSDDRVREAKAYLTILLTNYLSRAHATGKRNAGF